MINTIFQQPKYLYNLDSGQKPIKSSIKKIKTINSGKYCLNKPKLFNDFKNSSLFKKTSATNNLKQYSERFTFNQKSQSFQKNNLTEIFSKQYRDSINMKSFQKENYANKSLINKITKMNLNLSDQRSEIDKVHKSITSTKLIHKNKTQPFQNLNISQVRATFSQRNSLKRPNNQTLRIRTHNNQSSKQNSKLSLKTYNPTFTNYIKFNPKEFIPIELKFLKDKSIFNQNEKNEKNRRSNKQVKLYTRVQQKKLAVSSKKTIKSVRFLQQKDQNEQLQRQKQIQKQQIFKSLDQQVDKLFDILSKLRSLGYSEQKVNEWIWQYCQNSKKFLQNVLFKAQGYRSTLAQCKIIYRLQQTMTIKQNVHKFKRIINNQQMFLQVQDLSQLNNYLQQILINKQYFQLKRLQNQIQETSYSIKNNYLDLKDEKVDNILKMIQTFDDKKRLQPMEYYEMLNFYEDVKRLESHFGKINGLNNSNKKKCQNITEIQLEILRKRK